MAQVGMVGVEPDWRCCSRSVMQIVQESFGVAVTAITLYCYGAGGCQGAGVESGGFPRILLMLQSLAKSASSRMVTVQARTVGAPIPKWLSIREVLAPKISSLSIDPLTFNTPSLNQ